MVFFFHFYLFLAVLGLHCGARALRCSGFSCCRARALGTWAQQLWLVGCRAQAQQLWLVGSRAQAQQLWLVGSRAQAQQLWRTGLVAPRHVESSRIRARTRVPCIGRRILNHCATREAPGMVNSIIFFWFRFLNQQSFHRQYQIYKYINKRNSTVFIHLIYSLDAVDSKAGINYINHTFLVVLLNSRLNITSSSNFVAGMFSK